MRRAETLNSADSPYDYRSANGELTVCELQIIRAVIPAAPVASAKWSSASGVRRGNGSRCRGRALRVVVANPSGTRGLPPPGPTLRTRMVAILEASQQRSGRAGSGEWVAAARRNLQFSLRVPTRRTIRGLLDSCLRNPRERKFQVLVVNARAARHVPGRKTHVCDAQRLHEYGLLRASFRPQVEIAALRAYLRQRERLLDYAAAHVQHMQKALTQMNLRLHYVITDITSPLMASSLSGVGRNVLPLLVYLTLPTW